MARARLLVFLLAPLVAPAAAAEALAVLELRLRAAVEQQARAEGERAALVAQAERAAADVERAKGGEAGARAGAGLERGLRAFDALAQRLDQAEARLASRQRAVGVARAAFEAAAETEEQRLAGLEAPRAAERLLALVAVRARVAALVPAPPSARPALDVQAEADDGPTQLAGKLELLDAERRRLEDELARLAREESLLAARFEARQRLARDLGAARSQAGGGVALLERAADDALAAQQALHERLLLTRHAREAQAVGLRGLARRRQDLEQRLERLRAVPGREEP